MQAIRGGARELAAGTDPNDPYSIPQVVGGEAVLAGGGGCAVAEVVSGGLVGFSLLVLGYAWRRRPT